MKLTPEKNSFVNRIRTSDQLTGGLIAQLVEHGPVSQKSWVRIPFRPGLFSGFNRPFSSSLVPLFQSESKCEIILMKMTLICMKMKRHTELILMWKVLHLDSFWNRGTRELGNGLFRNCLNCVYKCHDQSYLLMLRNVGFFQESCLLYHRQTSYPLLSPLPPSHSLFSSLGDVES